MQITKPFSAKNVILIAKNVKISTISVLFVIATNISLTTFSAFLAKVTNFLTERNVINVRLIAQHV